MSHRHLLALELSCMKMVNTSNTSFEG